MVTFGGVESTLIIKIIILVFYHYHYMGMSENGVYPQL